MNPKENQETLQKLSCEFTNLHHCHARFLFIHVHYYHFLFIYVHYSPFLFIHVPLFSIPVHPCPLFSLSVHPVHSRSQSVHSLANQTACNIPQVIIVITIESIDNRTNCPTIYSSKYSAGLKTMGWKYFFFRGCDDLLPILSYVIIRSQLPQLVSECNAMEDFISPE